MQYAPIISKESLNNDDIYLYNQPSQIISIKHRISGGNTFESRWFPFN